MVQVLVEVEQHDPAVEERPDEVRPGRPVGEGAVAVDQHLLGHVGPGGDVHPDAEDVEPVHLAVGLAQELVVARSGCSAAAAGGGCRAPGPRTPLQRRRVASRSSAGLERWNDETNLFQCITMATLAARRRDPATACRSGPDSLTWRFFGDNRMALLGPRAAVLQNMLPALGQGVEDHSVWFAETLARLRRSIPPIFNTVYGADPETSGHEVRDFHRPIKGRLPDGYAVQRAQPGHLLLGARLLRGAPDHRHRHLHPTAQPRGEGADLRGVDHLVRAVRRELASVRRAPTRSSRPTSSTPWTSGWSRTGPRRTAWATRPRAGRDPKRIPRPVWWLVKRPVNAVSSSITIGGLPPRAREILGLPWDETAASGATSASRRVSRALDRLYRRLPGRYRMHPIALRAFGARGARPATRLAAWPTAHPWDCSTPTRWSTRRTARSSRPCASSSTSASARTSRSGTRTATRRCARSPGSWARSARSGCTSRATAAPARVRRPTGWPAWRSRPATRASAR